jgi:iron only hydrogenase large subunit-like protein
MNAARSTKSKDDLSRLLRDLKNGLPARMLIAPAAPRFFENFPRVLGYLHSLGVKAFYPVLPYADITVWAYYGILKGKTETKLIASACTGVNRYFKEHGGEGAGYLCPVFSPLLCAARYLKTYRRLEEPLAFLSPCLLKKTEFVTKNNEELVRYNITIDELNARLSGEGVDVKQYEPCLQETDENGRGLTLAAFGGIGRALAALLPDLGCHTEQGLENVVSYLPRFQESQNHAAFFEPYACKGGCMSGSGIGNRGARGEPNFPTDGGPPDIDSIFKLFSFYDKTLRVEDFYHPV